MLHRTNNHVSHYRCKDVQASFMKHRAILIDEATKLGLVVLEDDGTYFKAEGFNCCKERVMYHAGETGYPFANGPSINKQIGAKMYSDLFLPKA